MLCKSTTKEESTIFFGSGNYKANEKKDGERIIAVKKGKDVFLVNRRGREKSFIYPEIVEDLKTLDFDFIFDGEVTTYDGLFNTLQHRVNLADKQKIARAVKENPVIFYIFDVISFKGIDLRLKPLKERITYFDKIGFENLKSIGFLPYGDVEEMLKFAEDNKLEGIVIKDMNGIYEHRRSDFWIKLKLWKEIPIKAVRYTENPKGIRIESENNWACQVAGKESLKVKKNIDEFGYCLIVCQYLELTKSGMPRFISFKEMKNE